MQNNLISQSDEEVECVRCKEVIPADEISEDTGMCFHCDDHHFVNCNRTY